MESNLATGRGLGQATIASVVGAVSVAAGSAGGLMAGAGRYRASQSVLVSAGADVANLIAVVLLIAVTWLAHRHSVVALLMWPGVLFYLSYAYVPYLVGAPFTPLVFAYVVVFLAATYGLISILTTLDLVELQQRFRFSHPRAVGGVLTVIGVLAYAGLVGTAVGAFGTSTTEAAWRGHWMADWVLGTPALLVGGVLLWARRPVGYSVAPGLLLVSVLRCGGTGQHWSSPDREPLSR